MKSKETCCGSVPDDTQGFENVEKRVCGLAVTMNATNVSRLLCFWCRSVLGNAALVKTRSYANNMYVRFLLSLGNLILFAVLRTANEFMENTGEGSTM